MSDNWYDTAQICINGHVINSQSVHRPEHNREFCDKCGVPTITNCPKCSSPIRGYYHVPPMGTLDYTDLPLPSFCPHCGEPYPWTETKLKAARELTDLLKELSPEERETLKKSFDDIVRDTPQTTVAANQIKRIAAKLGKAAAKQLRELVVDIASETAKKIILGQGS